MTVARLAVSFDADLAHAVRRSAGAKEESISEWLAAAASSKLRNDGLAEVVGAWEAEHGAFTPEEIASTIASWRLSSRRGARSRGRKRAR
jgi:hypothetical protein